MKKVGHYLKGILIRKKPVKCSCGKVIFESNGENVGAYHYDEKKEKIYCVDCLKKI